MLPCSHQESRLVIWMKRIARFSITSSAIAFLFMYSQAAADPPTTAPPSPADYSMGTVVNGDFEAEGGSLSDWSQSTTSSWGIFGNACVVTAEDIAAGHTARLHSEGIWSEDPLGPGGPGPQYRCESGNVTLAQTVYVPADATRLQFVYCTRYSQGMWWGGTPTASVRLGPSNVYSGETTFDQSDNWAVYDLTLDESQTGRRLQLSFLAMDGGNYSGCMTPSGADQFDLYVDFVGLNGTTMLRNSTWSGSGGGAWHQADLWNPSVVPNNTTADAYDVVLPAAASGSGNITVASPIRIQSLDSQRSRSAGDLEILGGGSLTAVDSLKMNQGGLTIQSNGCLTSEGTATFTNSEIRIAAGGSMTLGTTIVEGGALLVHPEGSVSGSLALTVNGNLTLTKVSGGTPASATIRDAIVKVTKPASSWEGYLYVRNGSALTLEPTAGSSAETRIEAEQVTVLDAGSALILKPGAFLNAPLTVGSTARATVQSAKIQKVYGGWVSGLIEFTGPDCQVVSSYSHYGPSSALTRLNNATVTFGSYFSGSDVGLSNSTALISGNFSVDQKLTADATSLLSVGGNFSPSISSAANFDLVPASLQFTDSAASNMSVLGLNKGPFSNGLTGNFGVGRLIVDEGAVKLTQSGTGHAQYVKDLVLESGVTLDLNGVPLYYSGSFVNHGGAILGGEVRKAYSQPEGLPVPATTAYTTRATADGVQDQKTNATATTYGSRTNPGLAADFTSYASAEARIESPSDSLALKVTLSGGQYAYMYSPGAPPEPGIFPAADASGQVTVGLSIPATSQFPSGAPVDLLLISTLSGTVGSSPNWMCSIYQNDTLLATLNASNPEDTLSTSVGAAGLRAEMTFSDGLPEAFYNDPYFSAYFSDSLTVNIYPIAPVPEPGTIALLAAGIVGVLACFWRKLLRP